MKKLLFIVVFIVIVAGAVFIFSNFNSNGKFDKLATTEAEKGDISNVVIATGKIEPLSEIEVKSKIGGIISKLYVEEGDIIKKGQKIAEISPGSTPLEIVNVRNEVKRAYLEKENAKFLFEQGVRLRKKEQISENDYKNLDVVYQSNKIRFYSAMAHLQVYENGEALKELENSFNLTPEEKKAINKETEEVLKSMIIRSPIDGIVLSREQDEGTAVIPISSAFGGTVIMRLADTNEMHFKGDVDEVDIGKIYINQKTRIFVDAYKDKEFEGTLYHISPLGREKNNIVNFEIKVKLIDPEKLLKAGMSADAQIIVEEKKNILLVPESYIVYEENSEAYIYLFDETQETGKKKVKIKVGISDGSKTEILEGVNEGDKIVYPE